MRYFIYLFLFVSLVTCNNDNDEFVEKFGNLDYRDFRGNFFWKRGGINCNSNSSSYPVYSIKLDSTTKEISCVKNFYTDSIIPDSTYDRVLLGRLASQFDEMNIASLHVDRGLNVWVKVFHDENHPYIAYFSNPDSISDDYLKILYSKYEWRPMKYGWFEQILP